MRDKLLKPYRFRNVGNESRKMYAVDDNETFALLGTVERRETTKTGFRRGYCVGQVPTTRWFAFDADGRPHQANHGRGLSHGFATRDDAARALLALALAAPSEPRS